MEINGFRMVRGFHFNTVNTITAETEDEAPLQSAMDECKRYNRLLSKTIPESDVWRINHSNGQPVAVDPETMRILKTAIEISNASAGAFDVTVGPAVALWRFTDGSSRLPKPELIKEALRRVDYRQIELHDDSVTIPNGVQIDLGGIAKGYIADSVANELRRSGIRRAILNFGGNVVTIGTRPDGAPWQVGLKDPASDNAEPWAVVDCADATVVTSGIYERGFELDGKWYHHILDPRTGYPADNGLESVTVCSNDSMLADGLSTAAFLLGPYEGNRLCEQFGAKAVFHEIAGKIYHTHGLGIRFSGSM